MIRRPFLYYTTPAREIKPGAGFFSKLMAASRASDAPSFLGRGGLFFLVASNFIFVQMIVKEAIPKESRKPYWALLLIPVLLLAVV